MACDHHRARLRLIRTGALCVALSLMLVPWTGTAQEDSARVKVHVVKQGETLTRIAGIHGVTVGNSGMEPDPGQSHPGRPRAADPG